MNYVYGKNKGEIVEIEISAAGNATTKIVPGSNIRYEFLNAFVSCACDATVASRQIIVRLFNSSDDIVDAGIQSGAITASATKTLSLTRGPAGTAQGISSSGDYRGSFRAIWQDSDYLRFSVGQGVAGDTYTGRVRVLKLG